MVGSLSLSLKRAVVVTLLLLNAPLIPHNSTQAQTPDTPSRESAKLRPLSAQERVKVFEEVWKTIDEKYYDASFNGVDWKAVHERYRPRVDAVTSDAGLYALLGQMAGELRDAHTRVRSPRQSQDRKKQQATSLPLAKSDSSHRRDARLKVAALLPTRRLR